MKNKSLTTFLILASSFTLFSLTGCCKKPEPEILVEQKIVYLKQDIPKVVEPPKMLDYETKYLHLNDRDYYIMTLADGDIMLSNWDRFHIWGMSNYKILKNLESQKDSKK